MDAFVVVGAPLALPMSPSGSLWCVWFEGAHGTAAQGIPSGGRGESPTHKETRGDGLQAGGPFPLRQGACGH